MMTSEEAATIHKAGCDATVRVLIEMSTTIDTLEKQVAKLSKNSSNSSKPPSSDDITKPPKKPKKKGKRKIGAQPGHPKHERRPFEEDEIDNSFDYILVTVHDMLL